MMVLFFVGKNSTCNTPTTPEMIVESLGVLLLCCRSLYFFYVQSTRTERIL